MLSSIEGQAYIYFHSCNEGRNHTPVQILKEMDSIYNISITFWDLNARMCGLKQGMNEPIKTFYERMADISVKLEQYHGDRFGPGELKMMKKDCFYAGLKEHNKYLVSHMKDHEQYGPAQMLREIREQEDSRYPANTSPKPHHIDSGNKNTSHYNKNSTYDKPRAYTVRHTNVQIPDQRGDEPDLSPTNDIDPDEIYDEGYYVAAINTANEADKWGCCFNCGKEGHRWAKCKEPLKESLKLAKERANCKKQALNWDGGVRTKGAQPPPDGYGQGRKLASPQLTPSAFWNEDPRNRWLSSANLGTAVLDGVETTCLIDNGARVNLVTPEFVRERGLDVGSIQDLSGHNRRIPLSGLGGKIIEPLGYVMFQVQIPHVPSYDEDQVALVVVEDSHFLKRCQVMLGTPTINQAVRAMKESEMEGAPEAWRSAQHTYEFANYMIQLNPEDYGMPMPTNTGENPTDLDELVLLKNKVTILALESIILYCCTRRTMMMGYKLHVMTQASYPEDRANLLNGVYIVKTYTELHDGSRSVSVVLRNLTGKPVHLPAGWASGPGSGCKCHSRCHSLPGVHEKVRRTGTWQGAIPKDDYRGQAEVTFGTAPEGWPLG